MARNGLKNVARLIDIANDEISIENQFLTDLQNSIEKTAEANSSLPSKTYKPSGMNCDRAMVYQVLGYEPDNGRASYQLEGICESGTDRHIRIQKAIENMSKVLNIDCEYINVADFVKQRNLDYLEIRGQSGMETKLYHKDFNMSFMTDGIIKYKGKYFVFEFKTETADKFYQRKDIDPKHYNQATAYALAFKLDKVLFIYENRNTCDKKAFIKEVTQEMKDTLIAKLQYCNSFVEKNEIPPKPVNLDKRNCRYCGYHSYCGESL